MFFLEYKSIYVIRNNTNKFFYIKGYSWKMLIFFIFFFFIQVCTLFWQILQIWNVQNSPDMYI